MLGFLVLAEWERKVKYVFQLKWRQCLKSSREACM
jgi:hypothetical protein